MEETRERSSNFISLPGLALLIAAALASAGFRIVRLTVFLTAAFLVFLVARVWQSLALRSLKTTCSGASSRGFPGEKIAFDVTVANDKHLPLLWLDVELPKPARGFLAEENDAASHFFTARCGWLGGGRSVRLIFRLEAVDRGVYSPRKLRLRSGDGFGLAVGEVDVEAEGTPLIVVYPKVFDVDISAFMRDTADVSRGGKGYREDVTLLRSVRPYQPGDSFRRVNWRVLARQGEMAVNLYEEQLPRRATFIFDFFSFARYETVRSTKESDRSELVEFHAQALEEMISLAASCILKLSEKQVGCTLALPRTSTKPPRIIRGEAGEGMAQELLTALAGVEYAGELSWLPEQELVRRGRWLGQIFLFCESADTLSCRPLLEKMGESAVTLVVRGAAGSMTGDHPGGVSGDNLGRVAGDHPGDVSGVSSWRTLDYRSLRRW